jgi:uncharacterized protein YjbJ (UPF0337 family)
LDWTPVKKRSRDLQTVSRREDQGDQTMRPNKDEVRGKIDQITGKAKQVIGRNNADPGLVQEGIDQENSGDIEHGVGKARRKIGEAIADAGRKLGR